MAIITALEVQKRDPERVNVFVDGAFAVGLSTAVVVRRGLRRGMDVSSEDLETFALDDEVERAYSAALNFLSYRPRSTREVRDYFRRKGTTELVADAVIERLLGAGLVDDSDFARFWVENRQTFRPRGSRALRMEMRQKGLTSDIIDEALEDLGDEGELAYQVASGKARSFAGDDEREFFRRMVGFLQRRGFPYEAASRASRRVYRELGGDPSPALDD